MLLGVRYRCYTNFCLPAPVVIIARNMHLLVGFVFFRLGVASFQLDAFRCPNDYCSNGGECLTVTDYLAPVASTHCQPGWIENENVCYKVIWNQSQSHNSSKEACKEVNATLGPWVQNDTGRALATQLNNSMNVIQLPKNDRLDLWTLHCQVRPGNQTEQCVKLKAPEYDTWYFDDKQTQALPLCAKKPEIQTNTTRLRKQCKCTKNWGGDRCETRVTGTATDDFFLCRGLGCGNAKIYIEFSAFVHLNINAGCSQTGTKNTSVLHTAECYSPNSLNAVKYWCQGKNSCDITSRLQMNSNTSLIAPCNTSVSPPELIIRTSCRKNLTECPHLDNDKNSILHEGTCWHFVRKELTWWGALDFCYQHGGSLAFVPGQNEKFIPKHVLEKLASMPFNIWIGGEHNRTTIPTVQDQDCPYLHVEPESRTISRRSVSHSDKLKCDFGGPAYPWVCSLPPNGISCPSDTKTFPGSNMCYKMMHEPPSSWGEALAACKKLVPVGDLIYYSDDETFKRGLVDYLIETMKQRIWEFWIAGSSDNSRDPDKIPSPCSTGKVSNVQDLNDISTRHDTCNLSDTKSIALCVTPPIMQVPEDDSNQTTSTAPPLSSVTPTAPSLSSVTSTKRESISSTSLPISCKETKFQDNRWKTTWPATDGDKTETKSCPGTNSKGKAKWFCNGTFGQYIPISGPNMSECTALGNLTDILNLTAIRPDESATIVLAHVKEKPLFGSDISEILLVVDKIRNQQYDVEVNKSSEEQYETGINFTTTITSIVDELLGPQNDDAWLDYNQETRASVSTNLLKSVEAAGFYLATTMSNSSYFLSRKTVDILVANLSSIGTDSVNTLNTLNEMSVSIPDEINSLVNGSVIVVFTKYRNLSLALKGEPEENTERGSYQLNSEVIGVSVKSENSSFKFESGFVVLTIKHMKPVKPRTNITCVFWNTSEGVWDANGCFQNMTNETHTICSCNHLTNFAVIMDVHGILEYDSPHAVVLTWITILGCSLSIICLAITCITFISFRSLWSLRSTIHCNLCICLIVAQLILLVGLDRTEIKLFCSIVAGVLHFAWLSAFTWVALEGIHIYVLLVKVFDTAEQKTWLYYVTGYGLPALIVAISAAIKPSGYGTERYCWLSTHDGFIFSFAAPMLLVVLFNFVIFGLAMKAAASVKSQRNESMVGKTKLWIRRSASLIPLLGLSWIFGFMYANENAIIFAYFFAIFNSAQGLFIFIFHCIRNEKVQQVVTRFVIQQREKSPSNLFAKSRSNSCTVTSSVRTTTSSEDAGVNRGIRRSLVSNEERVKSRAVPSRWKCKLRITSNQISPDHRFESEMAQLKGVSFRRISDISL